MTQNRKSVPDDENQMELPLLYTHVYDEVEINSPVPWDELDPTTQRVAKRVVDYYRMQASIKVDAQIDIKSVNIEGDYGDDGMLFSLIATVDSLGGQRD
jgi:hypothetical protein